VAGVSAGIALGLWLAGQIRAARAAPKSSSCRWTTTAAAIRIRHNVEGIRDDKPPPPR